MQLLPTWRMTDRFPAFYDGESGSVIEMTARVYTAMNELIAEYNEFAKATNQIILDFKNESEQEQECFKKCVTELLENYIKSIDIKISKQDKVIADAKAYMVENIHQTVRDVVDATGVMLTTEYNDETESLDVVAELYGDELDEIIEEQNNYINGGETV